MRMIQKESFEIGMTVHQEPLDILHGFSKEIEGRKHNSYELF